MFSENAKQTRRGRGKSFIMINDLSVTTKVIAKLGHVAELVYAYVSEAYVARHGSSTLPVPTITLINKALDFYFLGCYLELLVTCVTFHVRYEAKYPNKN